MTTADGMHKMQYLAGAPMFGKGAVFVEEDSAPDDTNSPQILQQILSAKMGQVNKTQLHVFRNTMKQVRAQQITLCTVGANSNKTKCTLTPVTLIVRVFIVAEKLCLKFPNFLSTSINFLKQIRTFQLTLH